MMRSRLGLRAIGLCLALAGLMAVGAGSAQAEATSYWLVSGVPVTTLLPELQTKPDNHIILLGTIGGVGIHVLCNYFQFVAGNHLLSQGGWLGKILFTTCHTYRLKEGKAEKLEACKPSGLHYITELLKGLIRLHGLGAGTDPIIVLEPSVGTLFSTINTGEECAFGEKIIVSGKLALRDCENAFLTDKVTHLFEEFAPLTKLFLNGNEANKATIDGSINIQLAGSHQGLTWAGHPG